MPSIRRKVKPKTAGDARSSGGDERWGLDSVWEEIVAVNQLLRREMGRVLEAQGMFLSEYRALRTLENGPCMLGQVGRQLGLTPATLTTLARGLERRGWARLSPSPEDRRVSLLIATDEGIHALRRARRATKLRLRRLEGRMDLTGSGQLARNFRALRMTLEEAERGVK